MKRIELTVALKVCDTVMTSSPGSRPRPAQMDIRATVPLDIARACLLPQNFAHRSSSSATLRPPAIMPLARTSVTAAVSSGPRSGRAGGIMRWLLGSKRAAPRGRRCGD